MKQSNIKQKQYLISISKDKSFAQINQLIFSLKTNFLSIWNTTSTPHIAITYSWLVLNKLDLLLSYGIFTNKERCGWFIVFCFSIYSS